MRRAVAQGMVVGLAVGTLAAAWVILWPRRDGDFYEISDPLIFLGLPLVTIGVVLGGLLGGLVGLGVLRRSQREGLRPRGDRKSSP